MKKIAVVFILIAWIRVPGIYGADIFNLQANLPSNQTLVFWVPDTQHCNGTRTVTGSGSINNESDVTDEPYTRFIYFNYLSGIFPTPAHLGVQFYKNKSPIQGKGDGFSSYYTCGQQGQNCSGQIGYGFGMDLGPGEYAKITINSGNTTAYGSTGCPCTLTIGVIDDKEPPQISGSIKTANTVEDNNTGAVYSGSGQVGLCFNGTTVDNGTSEDYTLRNIKIIGNNTDYSECVPTYSDEVKSGFSHYLIEEIGEGTPRVLGEITPAPTLQPGNTPAPTATLVPGETPFREGELIPTDFTEGPHAIAIRAVDKAKNTSEPSEQIMLIVDKHGPQQPGILSLDDDTEKYSATIAGNTWDFVRVGTVGFEKSPPPADQPAGTAAPNGTPGAVQYNLASGVDADNPVIDVYDDNNTHYNFTTPPPLGSGVYHATIQYRDKVGNYSPISVPYVFYIDGASPAPVSTPAVADSVFLNNTYYVYSSDSPYDTPGPTNPPNATPNNIRLSWSSVIDGGSGTPEPWQSGIKGYNITIANNSTAGGTPSPTPAPMLCNPTSFDTNKPAGSYTIRISAVDNVGNESQAAAINVTVRGKLGNVTVSFDNDTPSITWGAPGGTIVGDLTYKVIISSDESYNPGYSVFNSPPFPSVLPDLSYQVSGVAENATQYAYIFAKDESGNYSITKYEFKIVPVVPTEPPTTIDVDETWTENRTINGVITVPVGARLTIEGGITISTGSDFNTMIKVLGTINVNGDTVNPVIFKSLSYPNSDQAWQGIYVEGTAEITGAVIINAKRGVSVVSGSSVSITGTRFEKNLVGVHVHNAGPNIQSCEFINNTWYGIKEDAVGSAGVRPKVTESKFNGNGHVYYHTQFRNIGIIKLNEIMNAIYGGNSNNTEGE